MNISPFSTSTTARTVWIGGPCGNCGHAQVAHAPAEPDDDCPAMCADCVAAPWCVDEESGAPAFHAYAFTAIEVRL